MNDFDLSTTWIIVLVLCGIWELVWKAIALWKAANHKQTGWFIAILIINSLGVLPIIYIYLVDKNPEQ